jgi:hypothetical protein
MAIGFEGLEIEVGGPVLFKIPKGFIGIEINVSSLPAKGVQKTVKKKLN